MTRISYQEFLDEYDNRRRIFDVIKRTRYTNSFLYLYNLFFNEHHKSIITKQIQYAMGIIDRPEAFQILEGFTMLNMLAKIKKGKFVKYAVINPELWEYARKEVKDGNRGKNKPS